MTANIVHQKALVRLELISESHVYDFHKLWSSEEAALYRQDEPSVSLEDFIS
jgi:hypothetical protein